MRIYTLTIVSLLLISMAACSSEPEGLQFRDQGRAVPVFSADSAYKYIESQVAFGPRVPNSEAHVLTKNYLRDELRRYAGRQSVFVQQFETEVYKETVQLANIIAAFNPQSSDRIVLAAHWDSRPRGENDPDHPEEAILGADDGGSGVGVLLEFARIFRDNPPPLGVDIIFFDGEDYGEEGDLANYFLGSRHWGNNPPVPGYSPRFGILLDMVGGVNAVFPKEGYSMNFAPRLVDELWQIASDKGHGDMFLNERGGMISDDHIIVQRYTGIPMINIIHHRVNENRSVDFPPYWHSQADNMDIIDKNTLQAVGDVVLELIYNRIP